MNLCIDIDDIGTPKVGDLVYIILSTKTGKLVARKIPPGATEKCPFLVNSFKLDGLPVILAAAFVTSSNEFTYECWIELLNTWDKRHQKKLAEDGWKLAGDRVWKV